jgi:hypothetical protein
MALEQELDTYLKERPRLLADGQEGRFVLIRGDQVHGTFETMGEALEAGYTRFGLDALFMVRQVTKTDQAVYFTRNVTHAHPDREDL